MEDNVTRAKDAATVILINESCEFLLMERSQESKFLPGVSVFPGGGLDDADMDKSLLDFAPGFNADKTQTGIFFAAIRELFEEAFILLAKSSDNGILNFSDASARYRFIEYRDMIHENKMTLSMLAAKENLIYIPEALTPFSRWITPKAMKTRYDTRFFIAVIPDRQQAATDGNELKSHIWIKANDAIDLNEKTRIKLLPPTLFILNELKSFSKIDEIIDYAVNKDKPVILPEAFSSGGTAGVYFPFDPDYSDPDYKLPPISDIPSRALITDNGWRLF